MKILLTGKVNCENNYICSPFTIVKITNIADFTYLFIKFYIRIPNTYYIDIDRTL